MFLPILVDAISNRNAKRPQMVPEAALDGILVPKGVPVVTHGEPQGAPWLAKGGQRMPNGRAREPHWVQRGAPGSPEAAPSVSQWGPRFHPELPKTSQGHPQQAKNGRIYEHGLVLTLP